MWLGGALGLWDKVAVLKLKVYGSQVLHIF